MLSCLVIKVLFFRLFPSYYFNMFSALPCVNMRGSVPWQEKRRERLLRSRQDKRGRGTRRRQENPIFALFIYIQKDIVDILLMFQMFACLIIPKKKTNKAHKTLCKGNIVPRGTVNFGATFFHNLTELNIRNSAFLSHEIRIT